METSMAQVLHYRFARHENIPALTAPSRRPLRKFRSPTARLARRPARRPDYESESRALSALSRKLVNDPEDVLQQCAERVLELCRADSAGISIREPGSENGLFRWRALVGQLATHRGSAIRLNASLARVIGRERLSLVQDAERLLPTMKGVKPPICETLLVPWHGKGEPVGMLWAIKHTSEGWFDAEDARLLRNLAHFAAAAYQVTAALDQAKAGHDELGQRVEERTRALSDAYQRVQRSEARLRAALAIETVGSIYLAPDGTIIEANNAFLAMGGYSRADVEAGRLTWQSLTPPEWMESSEQAIAELRTTGQATPYEKQYIRKDGSRWWALFAAKMLPDGTIFEFVLDITERKQTEERLAELQAELLHMSRLGVMGQMAAVLAHELNQPLTAIANYIYGADRLAGEAERSGPVRDLLRKASDQALRAGETIRRVREFVARGKSTRQPENLIQLVNEASALALIGAAAKGIHVRYDFDTQVDCVLADKIQIQQVLLNLIRNAVEALQEVEHRELLIAVTQAGADSVQICVSDTGAGISAEITTRLFQPFVTSKADGLGVGLSVCRSIVEAHHGRLWADPNPNGGTSFRFTLPVVVPQ
jgi:two-component system sensor kinase FixL